MRGVKEAKRVWLRLNFEANNYFRRLGTWLKFSNSQMIKIKVFSTEQINHKTNVEDFKHKSCKASWRKSKPVTDYWKDNYSLPTSIWWITSIIAYLKEALIMNDHQGIDQTLKINPETKLSTRLADRNKVWKIQRVPFIKSSEKSREEKCGVW